MNDCRYKEMFLYICKSMKIYHANQYNKRKLELF